MTTTPPEPAINYSDESKAATTEQNAEAQQYDPFYADHGKWYAKELNFGFFKLSGYNDATLQLVLMSFVFFLCPGMFNALQGLGGSGLADIYHDVASNTNVALDTTFAVFGFFGGVTTNYLGSKWTMVLGSIGYCVYAGALLYFHVQTSGLAPGQIVSTSKTVFPIFSGALLGICAGCLWSGQGAVMLSYPTEKTKGTYISVFWAIFNVGGVIGSIVPLAQTVHSKVGKAVSIGTYVAFIVLMFLGICMACVLLPASRVRKKDGTRVILHKNPTVWSELVALFKLLAEEPWFLFLFPMFFVSNWFYTYQQGSFNLYNFNIRTRALNGLLYWFMQIVGALTWGLCLDINFATRKHKAKVFHAIVFALTMAIWGGGYAFQKKYLEVSRAVAAARTGPQLLDWTDKDYIGPMFLYMFYGFYDSVFQMYCYWLMGAFSNSSRKLALYVGFYKGIQNVGGAIVWRLDANNDSFNIMFGTSWGLLAGSMVLAIPTVWFKLTDHTDLEVDAMFTEGIHAEELAVEIGLTDKALQLEGEHQ